MKAQTLSPRALVIDSIQTVHLMGVTGSAGGIYQVIYIFNNFILLYNILET